MDPDTQALLDMIDQLVRSSFKEVKKTLDYAVIQKDWMSLFEGMALKLEREFPPKLASSGAREFVWLTFRVALNTYKTMVFICAEKPPDPLRRPEYTVSCPPLVRTLVDSLFNIVFALEDLEGRVSWYYKAGWRENQERLERYIQTYGSLEEWKTWLETFKAGQEHGASIWGISAQERANLKLINFWPLPSQMVRFGLATTDTLPATRAFLQYLNDWFYRELSQESHMSFPGLAHRGGMLMELDKKEPLIQEKLDHNRSTQMVMTMTILLALGSEIDQNFNFGFKQRIMVLWGILSDALPIAKEVYQARYAGLLR
jgi:hypothetical protein